MGPLRYDARVQVLAIIAIGPTIEASVPHRGQIIRNQILPDLVALVGDGPKLAGLWLPLQPGGIANSTGEDAVRARCPIDLPDRGSLVFGPGSGFADVAVPSNPDIGVGGIWT